ncbi:hypothetical protein BJ875DRAFT_150637 [Amylocarpus encephaloides]|uniref:Uncharacterized protein n=1 Tax=Amylocarpus encephaloides TaxID=45428 RepID=A0A9P7YC50_9HELO|nr:hypothetical protein BJ875DRAFT_150637 [Amylocarpus encephaloides]
MAINTSYTTTLRQNRRRERPGSRTRRTISRKANILDDCDKGCPDANPFPPSSKASPRPLLRQDFDQCWQRWKLRQVKEEAQTEMDRLLLEQEQQRLFGGDSGDDGSLCLAILDVVMRLFGDIDYTDP